MNEHQQALIDTLEFFVGASTADSQYGLVLSEGRWYEPAPFDADEFPQGTPRYCYDNAAEIAVEYGMKYVEGYAFSSNFAIPIHHAWNVDLTGRLVDSTWDPVGTAYLGVEFDVEEILELRSAELTGLARRTWAA